MKRREQALLFLRKAAQDESLLDAVLECDSVSDEVIGFHCLARSGAPLPGEFENLGELTPFGAVYRYDGYDGTGPLNRAETRALLKSLRAWVEDHLLIRSVSEAM